MIGDCLLNNLDHWAKDTLVQLFSGPELLFQRCLELGASRNSFEGNLRAGVVFSFSF